MFSGFLVSQSKVNQEGGSVPRYGLFSATRSASFQRSMPISFNRDRSFFLRASVSVRIVGQPDMSAALA